MSAGQNKRDIQWKKIGSCLYRYVPSGVYYGLIKFRGKQIRRTLETQDLALARRKNRSCAVTLNLPIRSLRTVRSNLKPSGFQFIVRELGDLFLVEKPIGDHFCHQGFPFRNRESTG